MRLATERSSAGLPMLYLMLRNAGWKVNRKRLERLYREEKLMLRRRKKRQKYVVEREDRETVHEFGKCWSMDFMHDATVGGRKLKFLNVIDDATRYSVAIRVAGSISAARVIEYLEEVIVEYGAPKKIRVDNGPEFRSNSFIRWAFHNKIQVQFIEPGKPTQNALIESFNGRMRAECLNQQWFFSLNHASEITGEWRDFYNNLRPHSALGGIPPRDYWAAEQQKLVVNC
jgi:putative transposase